jgi:phage gp16-like protein
VTDASGSDFKKQRIRLIQACRSQVPTLKDDDAWRDYLTRETGKNSLRAMSLRDLNRIVEALRRDGVKKTSGRKAGARYRRGTPQQAMIRGIWIDLAKAGAVRDPSEAALAAFVKRTTGVEALNWLDAAQANKVIEALKSWAGRVGL